ncbi:MAG: thioredoxin family protein [Prevotellaceae bacterium]|jgi:thiol-disulfide isomerase/thioredoxin|nr:thioredoxin family protein [Prevotellaceae bacterium]
MKRIVLILALAFSYVYTGSAQSTPELLGVINKSDLMKPPYNSWYTPTYDSYMVAPDVMTQLKRQKINNVDITIFLGTWCADAQREVPRFMKILSDMGFPEDRVKIIGVASEVSKYKQSPTREEFGLHIYRIPTFIISRDGKEVNRIIEYPLTSLELDLLSILKGEKYTSSYPSYEHIARWVDQGMLMDGNIAFKGLANQIKPLVNGVPDLGTITSVFMAIGKRNEAANLAKIMYYLFPNDEFYYMWYARLLITNEEYEAAIQIMLNALAKETNVDRIQEILAYYNQARDAARDAVENK